MKNAALIPLVLSVASFSAAHGRDAKEILEATGVEGGLVVVIGCEDPDLLEGLRPRDSYLVQGLDRDAGTVEEARQKLHSRGVYGKVSVDLFDGKRLPYVRDIVNLLVARDLGDISMEEIHRVLAPLGVACIREGETWREVIEPKPADIDEWSHFLHDASGNAVAEDQRVGPPRRLRWVGSPRWCRSHEFPSSVQAVVTAGGRIFTIFDEGQTGIYRKLPQRCRLIARDAWSGVLLWKVPLRQWQPEYGTGTGNRWNIHHTIPRRLVAEGDRVYVTLRFLESPVSVLDAATGKVVTEALEGTLGADELLLSDGVLFVKIPEKGSIGATTRFGKDALADTLAAVDVKSGEQLWRRENTRVVPYALSAHAGRVVYHDMENLVCLDAGTGDRLWQAAHEIRSTVGGGSTLVITDEVVLFHGHGRAPREGEKGSGGFQLTALSLADGKVLWTGAGKRGQAGACTQPTDLFVVDGVVWCGGSLEGLDLHTGEIRKTLSIGNLISPGHHYRCHRSKATERFLIWPKRGAEFVDVQGSAHMRNDWLRAPCFAGATPANGLFYTPPSQCFCYPGVKVSGFLAMSAEPAEPLVPAADSALERGPAFGEVPERGKNSREDWPMYRHDPARSGSTATSLPAGLRRKWTVPLASEGSPPVIVGDRLWVAEKDVHRIRCLRTEDGGDLWSYTAGGRIDSPPTVVRGRVLLGCRDGSVVCLREADGTLVWRFRAAPRGRRLPAHEQLESAWPVHGSVLVQDDVVYFAAGRSSFLDGGIIVYGVDVETGRVLHSHVLEGPWPDIETETGTPFAMEGALPDLLVSDGSDLYMQRIKFDSRLNRLETPQGSPLGELDMGANHLVATGGFLDDTGFDRLYWMHSRLWPGFYFSQHAPKSGQLVVFDESTTYAVKYFYRRIQWSPVFEPDEQGYLLFADDNDNEPVLEEKGRQSVAIRWLPEGAYSDRHRRGGRGVEKGTGFVRQHPAKWQKMIPLRARAMVLAGDRLLVAGPPDVIDTEDPYASFEGRKGGELRVFSASDGKLLEKRALEWLPVFDGMAAARGRLYASTRDGKVLCLAGTE